MKELLSTIGALKTRFTQKLPSFEAHKKMAPIDRFPNNKPLIPPPDARIASTLLVLYQENSTIKFPLIVRPHSARVHSGQIAFPGGKYEASDQSYMITSLRETEEEIGVKIQESQVIGRLSPIYIPPSNFLVHPFVAFLEEKPEFQKNDSEVAEILDISLDELVNIKNHKSQEKLWRERVVNVPYFELNQKIVWGATAMILSEFLEVFNTL